MISLIAVLLFPLQLVSKIKMRISLNLEDISDVDLTSLYAAVGYGNMVAEGLVKRSFPPGVYPIAALSSDSRLIGLIRVFSDDFICSWLADIAVYPSNESNKVMKSMLEVAVERFGHTAIFSEAFESEIENLKEFGITPKQKLTAVSRSPTLQSPVKPEPYMH
jgi:hypothetical protein